MIIVLSKENISSIDSIFDFLKENNIGTKINPLISSGNGRKNYNALGISPRKYSDAMIHLFDRYFEEEDFKNKLEPFDVIMGNVSTDYAYGCCTFSESCQESFVSIGPKGDVYPCGRFDGIKELKLGNVIEDYLGDILRSDLRISLRTKRAEQIESCKSCDYTSICNAGCLSNAYMRDGNVLDKDYYCSGYKRIFSHIKERVKKELSKSILEV